MNCARQHSGRNDSVRFDHARSASNVEELWLDDGAMTRNDSCGTSSAADATSLDLGELESEWKRTGGLRSLRVWGAVTGPYRDSAAFLLSKCSGPAPGGYGKIDPLRAEALPRR
jgi:hypothetical protein